MEAKSTIDCAFEDFTKRNQMEGVQNKQGVNKISEKMYVIIIQITKKEVYTYNIFITSIFFGISIGYYAVYTKNLKPIELNYFHCNRSHP